jgi:hypothetical protein
VTAKERLREALQKDREERERRQLEGPRAFPLIGQLDDDGVHETEHPFLPDIQINNPVKLVRIRQWLTGNKLGGVTS